MSGWYMTEDSMNGDNILWHILHPKDKKSNTRAFTLILMSLTFNIIGKVSKICMEPSLEWTKWALLHQLILQRTMQSISNNLGFNCSTHFNVFVKSHNDPKVKNPSGFYISHHPLPTGGTVGCHNNGGKEGQSLAFNAQRG